MIEEIFKKRIAEYEANSSIDRLNILQEILQELALVSLSREGFFSHAEFHGGTCLRIFKGLDRFSEDLDFALKAPDSKFKWQSYLERIKNDMTIHGMNTEITDRSKADQVIKKAFIKTDSVGAIIQSEINGHGTPRKVRIKLEIDTNPPAGALVDIDYLTFPEAAAVTIQTLESCFATKVHALLCREYIKGRDWYDFIWYASKGTKINIPLLQSALKQVGPWTEQNLIVDKEWIYQQLNKRIAEIDWRGAREDVRRFIALKQQPMLDMWSVHFFGKQLEKLMMAWN
jgi:predicted nucleotidyltransferase component of viral defense system